MAGTLQTRRADVVDRAVARHESHKPFILGEEIPLPGALERGAASGATRPGLSAEGLFCHAPIVTLGYAAVSGMLAPLHLDVTELREADSRTTIADAVVAFARAV